MTVEEFEEFYAAAVGRLTGSCMMVGDQHEAQDVVQEAFVQGWSPGRQFQRNGPPKAWIRTVAWRLAVSRWRVRRSDERVAAQRRPAAVRGPDRSPWHWWRRCGSCRPSSVGP